MLINNYSMIGHFEKRRKVLAKNIENNTLVIIFSGQHLYRNSDIAYPFRQNSSFYYYTGIKDDDLICTIYKNSKGEVKTNIFSKVISEIQKTWFGNRISTEEIKSVSGINEIFDILDFKQNLSTFIKDYYVKNICINNSNHEYRKYIIDNVMEGAGRFGFKHVNSISKLESFESKQRVIKDDLEIQNMVEAIKINKIALENAFRNCVKSEQAYENNIISDIYKVYRDNNVSWAYPAIVAAGNNANTLHYEDGKDKIQKNDLILVDAGCEYNLYSSDVTRCFPKSGTFTKEQSDIYNIVLNANIGVINFIQEGNRNITDIENHCCRVLLEGLIKLGILENKSIEEYLKEKTIRKYYMHGFGHSLGLDTHDLMYYVSGTISYKDLDLPVGSVFTVEPGLYFDKNDKSIPEKYRGIGVRIEDDVLIADEGVKVLTDDIPKTISDVQDWIK